MTTLADRATGLAVIREIVPVSRETELRLDRYADLLYRWQRAKNLVGPQTLRELWTRHFADSAQVLGAAHDARHWVDLGSGAGFPGLVVAILLAESGRTRVELVESNARKAAFLRAVIRATGAPARVHATRIDAFVKGWAEPVDAVTARALAPLSDLLAMSAPLIQHGATGIFHKGREIESDITQASEHWRFTAERLPSRTHRDGVLVIVRDCEAKSA